jgi:hypothetical protein
MDILCLAFSPWTADLNKQGHQPSPASGVMVRNERRKSPIVNPRSRALRVYTRKCWVRYFDIGCLLALSRAIEKVRRR